MKQKYFHIKTLKIKFNLKSKIIVNQKLKSWRTDWSFEVLKQCPFSHLIFKNSQSPKQSHVSSLLGYDKKLNLVFVEFTRNAEKLIKQAG